MSYGFIKLNRNLQTQELMKDLNAFMLLCAISYRAKRDNAFNSNDLTKGESIVGDFTEYGLTRQKYRTALRKLQKWNFITIRITNKGTIVKLINYSVFDPNLNDNNIEANQQDNHCITIKQPSTNQPATTNKNIRIKEIKNIKEKIYKKEKLLVNQKKLYSDYVKMTKAQYQNLVDELGIELTKKCIEELDNYIPNMTRKPYTDHYSAIKSWVIKKVKSENLNSPFNPERKKMLTFNTQRSLGALEEIRAEENEKKALLQAQGVTNG